MAVLRKKDMEFYYKSDFALVVSLSDVLTNEVRVYTTDRKRYIVAEAEVIDEDTTRLWVRGNAESHILKPGRVNIEVWSRSGDVMLVALYWLEVWLSPTEVPEGQMDVTALAPYAIVDAYDMAVSAGYTGTREEYMAALLSAGTPSVDVAYLVDGSLDKTFSELADAWEEGHMLCVIDDGDVLPLSGVYDDSLVFSQVIGDELMIVTLMDDDSVEADVSELGGGCFIVPVSLSGGGAYSTTVPFAEVLDAYDSGKVVMYEHDKMRWIAQHKAVRSNVTTLFATNVKYFGSWNNSDPNMSTLRHSSNEVVAVSAVDLQPRLTAGTGIDITNNVISATGGGGTGIESIEQTVTSDESGGINVVTITMSDSTTADFEIMNGKKGDKGDKGDQGNSGYSGAAGELEVVNNLTDGGATSALSAEMGKVLAEMIGGTPTYEVEGNLMPFDGIVMGKKVTAITKASDNTINPTVTDAEGWAYVIVTVDRTQHLSYGMCGYNLAGESDGFGFFGIVYNPNNSSYYTGNINASIARNANIATYENAKINAITTGSSFNIHQIAINIPCSSEAMQEAMANKTLGLFTGKVVPKTTCGTMKESHNIFDSTIRVFSTVNYLNSNYIAVEPSTKYVMVGAPFVVKTYNASLTQTGTIYANQQPDYSVLQNVYGEPYCTFTTGANDAYIMLNNQIGGTSGVTDAQWEKWQKLTIYKASLGYKPIAPHWVSKGYEPITPRMYDLAFIGDSITFLGWYQQMFTKIAIKSHYANGTNSIAWTSSAMESKFQALIDAYSNGDVVDDFGETITAPQYIFVFLGTNADAVAGDMATTMGISVGSLSPTADRTQAMRKFIYMLRNAFPNAKIIGFAPYNNYNQTTIAKMVEVANAVESNYQYLGVKCLNLSKISGIMPDFDTSSVHTYLSDGIHPNDAGKELLSGIGAKIVEEFD